MELASRGFGRHTRAPTRRWKEFKECNLHAFRNPLFENQTNQQMICTIMMRDVTVPLVDRVTESLRTGCLPPDMREWGRCGMEVAEARVLDALPPEGDEPFCPVLDVVAVTEASVLPSVLMTPELTRTPYLQYRHNLVWAGYNANGRVARSKLLLGAPADFDLLGRVLSPA